MGKNISMSYKKILKVIQNLLDNVSKKALLNNINIAEMNEVCMFLERKAAMENNIDNVVENQAKKLNKNININKIKEKSL